MFSDRGPESTVGSLTVTSNFNALQRKTPNKARFFSAHNSSSQFWRGGLGIISSICPYIPILTRPGHFKSFFHDCRRSVCLDAGLELVLTLPRLGKRVSFRTPLNSKQEVIRDKILFRNRCHSGETVSRNKIHFEMRDSIQNKANYDETPLTSKPRALPQLGRRGLKMGLGRSSRLSSQPDFSLTQAPSVCPDNHKKRIAVQRECKWTKTKSNQRRQKGQHPKA
jgi:hypothetical protein